MCFDYRLYGMQFISKTTRLIVMRFFAIVLYDLKEGLDRIFEVVGFSVKIYLIKVQMTVIS